MNLLSKEQSAYLRSAAHQPVHWNPWSPEAFERARKENKPVLLDIGAVWCHWCHVMDMESYENESIAKLINERYVAIKVDRDERPDVDARYQAAVSAISGQGGWPLTAFLMPDGKVFYGGTYFPPEDRHGRAGFPKVLTVISDTYQKEPEKATQNAEEIDRVVKSYLNRESEQTELSDNLIDAALNSISREHDVRYGGFGGAPKFPHPSAIELLLSRYDKTREQWMIDAVAKTLRAMANGGVYDQLGGGFHRYSTDEKWIVPHFEKMLYDNAPLLKNYTHAFQATGDIFYKDVALDIIRYIDGVLSDRESGGFYASQDADVSFGDDGSYFTWTLDDAGKILSADELDVLKLRYNIYEQGEMHHDPTQNVLFVDHADDQIAEITRKPIDEVRRLLDSGETKMQKAREQRKPPFVDTTIYASWNGMMISAYLHAYRAFGQNEHRSFALKSLQRILTDHKTNDGLISHRLAVLSPEAFLDDQVEILQALLDAFEITSEQQYLEKAESLAQSTMKYFWDTEEGGFTDIPVTANAIGALQIKNKPIQDSPTAGANAVAIIALLRLHTLTEKPEYQKTAELALQYFAGTVKNHGIFAATYFSALDMFLNPPPHIVVVSPKKDPTGEALFHSALLAAYKPNAIISWVDPNESSHVSPAVRGMIQSYSKPAAYVCSNFVCSAPAYDAQSLAKALYEFNPKAEAIQ
ncbi:MAG: thioredoxin domain-containing protein [Ignavibacteriae bacterium]|nr:thioredoxin domain-containing protein [Ignavibacteriota bacterium]